MQLIIFLKRISWECIRTVTEIKISGYKSPSIILIFQPIKLFTILSPWPCLCFWACIGLPCSIKKILFLPLLAVSHKHFTYGVILITIVKMTSLMGYCNVMNHSPTLTLLPPPLHLLTLQSNANIIFHCVWCFSFHIDFLNTEPEIFEWFLYWQGTSWISQPLRQHVYLQCILWLLPDT